MFKSLLILPLLFSQQAQAVLLSHSTPQDFALTADPSSPNWKDVPGVVTSHDRYGKPVPNARTEIRSQWTNNHLYFLFISQFEGMRLTANPSKTQESWGIWDYDVVEVFIGHDLERIHLYKEFEVTPQDEWVDLDVDKQRKGREIDWLWNSHFRFKTRTDNDKKLWICEMQIPWPAIDPRPPKPANELRLNLYRIEGSDPNRKYITWRPVNSPSYHTPEAFGRLRLAGPAPAAKPSYDLLLKGGHVIDPKNNLSAPRDVAILSGKIAGVAPKIDPALARKVVDVSGLYLTPGLIDLHTHVINGSGLRGSLPIDQNVYPDSHTLKSGVTTAVDAGTSGWRTFPDFKANVIDKVHTRILASLNIVGWGQAGAEKEQDVSDMDPKAAAAMAAKHKGLIVGIKTAHYRGPEWTAVERAVEAGNLAGLPVMVDFGTFRPERPYRDLVLDKLRPGDMSTHTYLANVPMLDANGRVFPYLFEAQKRGVKFDTGHGMGSFVWRQAAPAVRQGFLPDSISTDLHTGNMNGPMNNMLNVLSKFLALDMKLEDVILRATWNPARQIHREDLGHLSIGAPADLAAIRLEKGKFGFVDVYGAKLTGTQRLTCELTVRDGYVVYDLNGLTRPEWSGLGKYDTQFDANWDKVISPGGTAPIAGEGKRP